MQRTVPAAKTVRIRLTLSVHPYPFAGGVYYPKGLNAVKLYKGKNDMSAVRGDIGEAGTASGHMVFPKALG